MKKKGRQRTSKAAKRSAVVFALVAAVVLAVLTPAIASGTGPTSDTETTTQTEDLLDIIQDAESYENYLAFHEDAAHPDTEIVINGDDFLDASEDFYVEDGAICTLEDGSVTFEVDVPEAGFYNIRVKYYPTEGKNSTIERALYINGEIPFENAQYLEFSRIWVNAEEITRDSRDNDVRPKQAEAGQWMEVTIKDSDGYYQDAFDFYFEAGKNTITLESVKEPMKIGSLTLMQEEALQDITKTIDAEINSKREEFGLPVKE